jgi:hypothetical protein
MTASNIVHERELYSLVEDLDAAAEILESIGFRGAGDDALALPLRESFTVKHAIERAVDYLATLRFHGGRP